MRILFLTDGFPYPLISGRLRQFHFIRQLSARHRVTLLSLVPPGHPSAYCRALEPYAERIETIVSPQLSGTLLGKVKDGALGRLSRGRYGTRATLVRRIHELHAEARFDVVINARVYWPTEQHLPGVPVVADQCDAVSAALLGRLRVAPWRERPAVFAKLMKTRRDEARMLRSCQHLILASVRDWDILVRRPGATVPTTILPNGVDVGYWRRQARMRPQDVIVFNGSMGHPPNDDAARHLIERILPLVRRSRPAARVRIIGRNPSPRLRAAAARVPGVELTGYVDDMRPYLEEATVAALPLRFASGVQNKILEAMAMEIPVVTTPIAAVALRGSQGEPPPAVIAEGEAALAQAIVEQLAAAERDACPDAAARTWVAHEFDWSVVGERLHELICAEVGVAAAPVRASHSTNGRSATARAAAATVPLRVSAPALRAHLGTVHRRS
jgi:polysaccharide biosynthesis protein PslH